MSFFPSKYFAFCTECLFWNICCSPQVMIYIWKKLFDEKRLMLTSDVASTQQPWQPNPPSSTSLGPLLHSHLKQIIIVWVCHQTKKWSNNSFNTTAVITWLTADQTLENCLDQDTHSWHFLLLYFKLLMWFVQKQRYYHLLRRLAYEQ